MLLAEITQTSSRVAGTRSRLAKIDALAARLRRLSRDEVRVAVPYLSGELPGGTIGVGWATLRDLPPPAEAPPVLELLDVQDALERVRGATGPGSQALRRSILTELFGRATQAEQAFLSGLLLGELRQGALEGVMVEAIARAAAVPGPAVRRAAMLAGDVAEVAAAAFAGGEAALAALRLTLLRPIQPMLASTADDVPDAMGRIGRASVEWKLDGARLQVHRSGREVRAFTRNLADVTPRVPEVVAAVRSLPARSLVLDGEAIALRDRERPMAFQDTMSRFGTRRGEERPRPPVPLHVFFFDCVHVDGEDLLDAPLRDRWRTLERAVPAELLVRRIETDDADVAAAFFEDALRAGHEGVMVKSLDAPYEAGRRGAAWLKVKRAVTLDLVVLAAEWGHGRRRGWLSNLHLGARDARGGGFVMLGKTFKGLTDEMLTWQTKHLLGLETRRDEYTVYVRPELLVEVAFDGVQASTRYAGGVALRFARVKGYRPDKRPRDADTIDTVRALLAR